MPRGQASLEYVGVLALVAVVLGAGALFTGAPDLAGAVGAQIRRGLCIVTGGDCLGRAGPIPCVVRAVEESTDREISVVALRLADGRVVLREERSDGTVAVTVAQSNGAGGAVVFGARVRVGKWETSGDAELGAKLRASYARRFVRPDGPSADRLVADLAEHDPDFGGVLDELTRVGLRREDDGPAPVEREYALGAEVEAEVALNKFGLGAYGHALGAGTLGLRLDERTGERTVVLRMDREMVGALTAPRVGLEAALTGEATGALTFDRTGQPVRLSIASAQAIRGSARLGPYEGEGGDRLESEVRLELTDRAARADLLGALVGQPGATARTARRFADDARVDLRLYATSHEESTSGVSGSLQFVGAGYDEVSTLERRRLLRAAAREPGQGWGPNLDCELAA